MWGSYSLVNPHLRNLRIFELHPDDFLKSNFFTHAKEWGPKTEEVKL
jgi:hypothetical protein